MAGWPSTTRSSMGILAAFTAARTLGNSPPYAHRQCPFRRSIFPTDALSSKYGLCRCVDDPKLRRQAHTRALT